MVNTKNFSKNLPKGFAGLLLLFIFVFPVDLYGAYRNRSSSAMEYMPAPTLLYPVTDKISLEGSDFLEFRWKRTDIVRTSYYELRLYKGYQTIASTLIFKQRYSRDEYPVRLPASRFEENQVYTWSLRQIFFNGEKSDRAFSPFKIIKK